MPKLFTVKKSMPCGYSRTGKLGDHLQHYQACKHADCKKRLKAWDKLLEKFTLLAKEEGN